VKIHEIDRFAAIGRAGARRGSGRDAVLDSIREWSRSVGTRNAQRPNVLTALSAFADRLLSSL